IAGQPVCDSEQGTYPSQTSPIVQRLGEGLRCTQGVDDTPKVSKSHKHIAQIELEVDGLREGVVVRRKMLDRDECLFEVHRSLAVRSAGSRLLTGLLAIGQSFVPHFSPEGVIGYVCNAIGTMVDERFSHLSMDTTLLFLRQCLIDDLLGEGGDECIDEFRQTARLCEPPSRL